MRAEVGSRSSVSVGGRRGLSRFLEYPRLPYRLADASLCGRLCSGRGVARGGCDEAGGSFVRARDLSHPVGAADLCRVRGDGAGAGVAGGADDITKVTRHDLLGSVTDVRQPMSTGSDAGTTLTSAERCTLVFSRPARSRDRGVRYEVTVDEEVVNPPLSSNAVCEAVVDAGNHVIEVRAGRRPPYRLEISVRPGAIQRFEVLPSPWNWLGGAPRIFPTRERVGRQLWSATQEESSMKSRFQPGDSAGASEPRCYP